MKKVIVNREALASLKNAMPSGIKQAKELLEFISATDSNKESVDWWKGEVLHLERLARLLDSASRIVVEIDEPGPEVQAEMELG